MDEINCSLCGTELQYNVVVYGLTSGIIDENSDGFRIDSDSEWDVYCAKCMNEIDRMIATHRQK